MRILRDPHSGRLGLKRGLPAVLLGFLATSFQVYLLREFAASFYGNELTFGLVLGGWLLWGGIGSLTGHRLKIPATALPHLYLFGILLFFSSLILLRFAHRILGALPGEITGLAPALAFSLLAGLLVSFPLGLGFVLNSALLDGDSSRVYLLESAGAVAAGLAVHFILIPWFSNWTGAALISAAAGMSVIPARGRGWTGRLAVAAACGLMAYSDLPSQRLAWQPFHLAVAEDTAYGKLQAIVSNGQVSLFDNGLRLFTSPDPGAAEEAVHFALLQRHGPREVLLIGGAVNGAVAEVLKYADTLVEAVELDPAVIRLAGRLLPEEAMAPLRSPRVRIFHADGRAYLESAPGSYDAVLLCLPEPATAQINRFYTHEFALAVRKKLRRGGVFGFSVPSAENYISHDLGQFLASLESTLRGVFSEVAVVPGENNVFLASDLPLSIDPVKLSESIRSLGLRNRFVRPEMIGARLNPLRTRDLMEKIRRERGRVNRDLVPVGYYFHSVLWASQFRSLESRLLRAIARVPRFWFLDFPLLVIFLFFVLRIVKKTPSRRMFLVPIACAGFTSIVAELAVLIAFQARFGCVYGRISLLLASFMAGIFLGALLALKIPGAGRRGLAVAQGAAVLLLLLTLQQIRKVGGEVIPFLLLAALGAVTAGIFILSNTLAQRDGSRPGKGYSVDLLASFIGAILASSLLIPLWGIPALLGRLAVLNALCFLLISGGLPASAPKT